jgi:hypothetical protein
MLFVLLLVIGCGDENLVNNNNSNGNEHFNYVINTAIGGDSWEWGRDIVAVPTGGYVLTGWTDSYGQGRNDLYLVRIDANGNVLWESNFGGTQNNSDDIGEGVALTLDGNIIATGVSNAFGNAYQRYIVKVDMNGNLIWETTIGKGTYESASKVFPVSDGYIVGGNEGIFVGDEYYVMKIDIDGNLVWDSVYTNTGKRFRCMTPTSDNGFVLGGSYILKVDQNGVAQWSDNTLGHTEADVYEDIYSIIETSDGSIIAAGSQVNDSSAGPNPSEVYVVKYNSGGTVQWSMKYDFGGFGYIVENTDGTFSIAYINTTTRELYIAKITNSGDLISNFGTGVDGSPMDMINGHTGYAITGAAGFGDPNGSVLLLEIEERLL